MLKINFEKAIPFHSLFLDFSENRFWHTLDFTFQTWQRLNNTYTKNRNLIFFLTKWSYPYCIYKVSIRCYVLYNLTKLLNKLTKHFWSLRLRAWDQPTYF